MNVASRSSGLGNYQESEFLCKFSTTLGTRALGRGQGDKGKGETLTATSPLPLCLFPPPITKICNNSVVQALHLIKIYVAPSVWRVVFQ